MSNYCQITIIKKFSGRQLLNVIRFANQKIYPSICCTKSCGIGIYLTGNVKEVMAVWHYCYFIILLILSLNVIYTR